MHSDVRKTAYELTHYSTSSLSDDRRADLHHASAYRAGRQRSSDLVAVTYRGRPAITTVNVHRPVLSEWLHVPTL